MIIFIFTFFISLAWSAQPIHWTTLIEVQERHEFYQNNEVITKPGNSWQILFAVIFPDRNLGLHKDCVYYRVPGESDGIFKVKAIPISEGCEKSIDEKGDLEIKGLKSLQFAIDNVLTVHFTFSDYRSQRWTIPLMNKFKAVSPDSFTSSAQFRAPKLILLAPVRELEGKIKDSEQKKDGELCHAINDDCEELSPSSCQQCPENWYEITNGCLHGPKYCGNKECGLKNLPACRRGMKYQRIRRKFECRTDSSFAYCAPGLTIQCQGAEAYCR